MTPTPAVPADQHRARASAGRRRRGPPRGARTPRRAPRTARSCTCRAWRHSTGGPWSERGRGTGRIRPRLPQRERPTPLGWAAMTDGRRPPHPANTLNELPGRGVALLHQVAPDDGLPVRARPRRPQGARREQAAAADGPADRVLQPDRRARPRPVRRGRRDAARRGDRARAAAGARHRARSALGGRLRAGRARPRRRARRPGAASSPTSGPPTRAARAGSIRPGSSCGSATRWRCCRRSRASRSTSSPPTRRTTSSCR